MKTVLTILTYITVMFYSKAQVNYNPRNTEKTRILPEETTTAQFTAPVLTLKYRKKDTSRVSFGKTLKEIKSELAADKSAAGKARRDEVNAGKKTSNVRKEHREKIISAYRIANYKYGQAMLFKNVFFPVRNRLTSRHYYSMSTEKTLEVLKSNSVSISSKAQGGSIYTELIAGYLSVFRFGLGAMVSQTESLSITAEDIVRLDAVELDELRQSIDSTNSANLTAQNILGGGGNLIMNFSTPFIDFETVASDFSFTLAFFERLGFVIPEVGTMSNDPEITNQIGLQLDLWLDLNFLGERDFAFGFSSLVSAISNKEFANSIGLESGNSTFFFAELTPSIELDRRFRIFANIPFLFENAKFENAFKANIGVSIIPYK